MGSVRNVLVVVGLLLLPALLITSPAAVAGAPKAQSWASSSQVAPGGPILALAASDTLDSMAVGTADSPSSTAGTTTAPTLEDDDFFSFNFTRGLDKRLEDGLATRPSTPEQLSEQIARSQNEGTSVVAASADGKIIAGGASFTAAPNLYVLRSATGSNWSKTLPLAPTALALSDDGGLLAVATSDASTGRFLLFTTGGTGTETASSGTLGPLSSVAMSGDGEWIVVGGRQVVGGLSYGALSLYHRTSFSFSRVWNTTLPVVDDSIVLSVRMSRDGNVFAAATQAGGVLVYATEGAQTTLKGSIALGRSVVTALALSQDGRALAVGNQSAVVLASVLSTGEPAVRWTYSLGASQPPKALSLSADGTYLAVANGRAFAFHAGNATPIWTLAGLNDVRSIVLSSDGTRVALADGSRVYAYDATRAFSLGLVTAPGRESSAANLTTKDGVPLTLPVRVRNDGSVAQTFTLSVNATGGLSALLEPSALTLRPGEAADATLSLTPRNVGTGFLRAVITASAPGAIPRNATVTVGVEATRGFTMEVGAPLARTVEQGDTDEILLILTNTGNVPATVGLSIRERGTPSATWNYTLTGADASGNLQVPAKTFTTSRLRIEVPKDAPDGARMNLTITATSGQTRYTESVTYLVNPVTAIESSIDGSPRVVEPGRAARYIITVKNTGTTDALVRVASLIEDSPEDPRGWNVNVEEYSFLVAKGATHKLNVTVTVPGGREPGAKDVIGESLRAVVSLSLADRPLEFQNHTLVVNAVAPKPKPLSSSDQPNTVPGLDLLLFVGAVAAAAALAARRPGVRRQ